MCNGRKLIKLLIMVSVLAFPVWTGSGAASTLVPQTWLPGDDIFGLFGFTQPLPVFGPGYNATLPRVDASTHPSLQVTMKEIDQVVLPQGTFYSPSLNANVTLGPTRVWAYETSDAITGKVLGPALWPAVTLENKRYVPTMVKYVNELPSFGLDANALLQGLVTVDQSIHWADPLMNTGPMHCEGVDCTLPANASSPCCQPFTGPVPVVPHLHGQETFSGFDGGPEQWFTPDGRRGKDYYSLGSPGPNEAIYFYNNQQEPGTLWFHDHALGATRTNVYSGLAAFYFLRDSKKEPANLPSGAYEIEMAIQDRQFDTKGQLFWPDGSSSAGTGPSGVCGSLLANDPCFNGPPPNPNVHPFWIPEFIGDVAIVNGAPWPVLNVEPRRYLFRLLGGSNARMYRLTFGTAPAYVIGSDDNYLDAPVPVNQVFFAPGERVYVMVDFTNVPGQTITVMNDAPVPYPMGLVPGVDAGQLNMNKIMQFKVILPLNGTDTSCNPALPANCKRQNPMVRLTDGNGNLAAGVKIDKKRQLILKEHEGPGGPLEVLVNNTKWMGLNSPSIAAVFPVDGISELPRVGSTELWEIINLTVDAHPMHTHLVQFQILNRQAFNPTYLNVWGAAFGSPPPAACTDPTNPQNPCPGFGPPLPYLTPNADGAIGGNPAIGPYLTGSPRPPDPWESGWKDTAKIYPGEVMKIVIRWAPSNSPGQQSRPGRNLYSFDPTKGPGYVWHCHIIDHEDNEMMRPYKVAP
jgi:spore coat protein A, manganese oxidase